MTMVWHPRCLVLSMDSPDSSTSSGYEYGRNKVLENKGLAISQLTLNAELNEQAYPQYAIKLKETKEQGEVLTLSIRQFEDIQWLYNCLRKGCDKCGIIYPPMPDPPADFIEIDAEENIDRKLRRESKRVTRYLDSLTSHPTLKSCPEIEIFLKEKVLPEKEEEKASLFSKISSLFTSKSSSAFIRDIDDFFELEQIYATKYEQLIRQLNEAHTEVVECLKRLAGQHGHIGACLSMPVDGVSKRGKKMIHIHAQMTSYFKNFQFWMELAISSSQVTLGQAAGFYWAYTCNELEMFQRRKDLLIEYQEANATLGKSVGQKREVAAKKQKEVERKLEECSDTARDEIRWFVKKRSKDLLSTVQEYAAERSKYEHKILLAIQDSLEELRKAPE